MANIANYRPAEPWAGQNGIQDPIDQLFRGFAPASSKATFSETLDQAIQVVRSGSGMNGPIHVTAHPVTLSGITAPLGVTLTADARVPAGSLWVSIEALETDGAA